MTVQLDNQTGAEFRLVLVEYKHFEWLKSRLTLCPPIPPKIVTKIEKKMIGSPNITASATRSRRNSIQLTHRVVLINLVTPDR